MTLQTLLLKLARAAIEEKFGKPFSFSKEILLEQFPQLAEDRATFVTINIDGDSLRGCIGSLLPHTTLYDDVIYNARAAAFGDARFMPLSESEYPHCSIEISLLNLPEEVSYHDKADLQERIRPGIDGVILQHEEHSANFLPQVWKEFPGFEQFFAQLGVKAGITRTFALDLHPRIYTYEAESFKDESLEHEYDETPEGNFGTPQAVESAFYAALERGDIDAMLSVWADDDNVVCIHPGGERLRGRKAVEESWRAMLEGQQGLRFEAEGINVTQEGSFSIHSLRERILVDGQPVGMALATNVYRLVDGEWRMLMHHASPAMGG